MGIIVGGERSMIQHWLRKPWPNVMLVASLGRFYVIQAQPHHRPRQVPTRIGDPLAVSLLPAYLSLLHDVLSLG
jgi:hypothetical protein